MAAASMYQTPRPKYQKRFFQTKVSKTVLPGQSIKNSSSRPKYQSEDCRWFRSQFLKYQNEERQQSCCYLNDGVEFQVRTVLILPQRMWPYLHFQKMENKNSIPNGCYSRFLPFCPLSSFSFFFLFWTEGEGEKGEEKRGTEREERKREVIDWNEEMEKEWMVE